MSAIDDQDKARAESLGRLAGQAGVPLSDCPYGADERVLRARWARAYAGTDAAQARLGGGDGHT